MEREELRARHGLIAPDRMCDFLYGAKASSEGPRRPSLWLLVEAD